MTFNKEQLKQIKDLIRSCMGKLYESDYFLFERNNRKGISERGLVFRFAHYLQNEIIHNDGLDNYYVDCDFNSSFEYFINEQGDRVGTERGGKGIRNVDGTITKRFVDIIVHKRDYHKHNDFICFEFKKWNNNNAKERRKDFNNLIRLTSDYGYLFGFHIVFGKKKDSTRWSVFNNGSVIEKNTALFNI